MQFPVNEDRLQEAIESRFQCGRCGHCCKGDGLVHVGPAEADAMAAALGMTRKVFLRTYALKHGPQQWILKDKLVEQGGTGPREIWCIFLQRGSDGLYGCRVNTAKPAQCGSFPAKWRNPDSFETCAGLRHLLHTLKRESVAEADAAG